MPAKTDQAVCDENCECQLAYAMLMEEKRKNDALDEEEE